MPRKLTKKKGGSPASKAVMNLMNMPDAFMIVPLMKGGSPASNIAMSSVQQICNCTGNKAPPLPKILGNLMNFHKTTGGSKKRTKKGGSVPYCFSDEGYVIR